MGAFTRAVSSSPMVRFLAELVTVENVPELCHLRAMTSHPNTPPQLPEVTDEAADTPSWVPKLGLVLAVLAILWVIWSHGHAGGMDGTATAGPETGEPAAPATDTK